MEHFELVEKLRERTGLNYEEAKAALDFFKWSFQNGQPLATQLDYVPLPASLVQQIEAYWAQEFK